MKKLEKHIEKLTSKKNLLEKLMKESKDPTAQIRFDDAIRFYKEEINELKEIEKQQQKTVLNYHRYLTENFGLDLNELWVDEFLKDNNCV